jgi:hypothetical protein
MSKGGVLNAEEALESGLSLAKKAGKNIAGIASDTAKAATSQITGQYQTTQDFVKDLYGPTVKTQNSQQSQASQPSDNSKIPQTPEEAQEELEKKKKIEELKAKLHDEVYYQPLVNPQKGEPERPVEKVEREKKEEMVDLQKKEEEKPPPLVQRNQQRVEKFPGGGG